MLNGLNALINTNRIINHKRTRRSICYGNYDCNTRINHLCTISTRTNTNRLDDQFTV